MTAQTCQLALFTSDPPTPQRETLPPVVQAGDLLSLQIKLSALGVGDALVADDCRVERFVSVDGDEVFALIAGGFVRAGIWRGGAPKVIEVANTRAARAWVLRKFALAMAWRTALDCEIWRGGAGLDRHDAPPQFATALQMALAM